MSAKEFGIDTRPWQRSPGEWLVTPLATVRPLTRIALRVLDDGIGVLPSVVTKAPEALRARRALRQTDDALRDCASIVAFMGAFTQFADEIRPFAEQGNDPTVLYFCATTPPYRQYWARALRRIKRPGAVAMTPLSVEMHATECVERIVWLLAMRMIQRFAARAIGNPLPPAAKARAVIRRMGRIAADIDIALCRDPSGIAEIRAAIIPPLAQAFADADAADITPNDIVSLLFDNDRSW